ncbi:hypothetical protein B0T25DRAFT_519408 [Lasiosphaeria hispida]|uniref:Uncharacterized protein n=1 Tax=Lasiosphaeria hispida TaxID=260671 RepID=A0AAJ0HE02_9PEZI|nr:hypothetical protein B0T25DRAFT_519408 [Lasiosphaeria hispida]
MLKGFQLVRGSFRVDPDDFPTANELGTKRTGFKNMFYWGPRECNIIRNGRDPREVLKALLACKHFLFVGTHCFYALNTFAFSSLGEFYRFCTGIGAARVDRLQNLEITLMGNQYITVQPDPRQRYKQAYSLRSHALCWLTLRGMFWVRFYDMAKSIEADNGTRCRVKDWSFSEDVMNTSTMKKVASRQPRCELEGLEKLKGLENHVPSNPFWKLIKTFFLDDSTAARCAKAYDDSRQDHENLDLPS